MIEHNFRSRVSIERRALELVNAAFPDAPPLAGLSFLAIGKWCTLDARRALLDEALRKMSQALRQEADISGLVFELGADENTNPEEALNQLVAAVDRAVQMAF